MLSYTQYKTQYQNLSEDSTTVNISIFNVLLNVEIRRLLSRRAWPFLQASADITTTASTRFFSLRHDFKKLISVYLTVDEQQYVPREAPNRAFWDRLISSTDVSSDRPEWYYIFDNQIGFYPKISSADNTITYIYDRTVRDILIADYTTGTIKSIANGATTVTGDSTVWTSQMIGRFIRITRADTVGTGDGDWYEISSVTSTTVLELTRPYQGTTLAAATAGYIIGEMSLLPESYDVLPMWPLLSQYWLKNGNQPLSDRYDRIYNIGVKELDKEFSAKSENVDLSDTDIDLVNPNLQIEL